MTNQQPINHHLPAEQLPLTGKVAIYARAATHSKIEKQPIQTNDLLPLALQLGWSNEQIIVFDQDNGLSGDARRPQGISALIAAIVENVIKAVLVSNENRLFRDIEAIQVQTFIRLCSEHNVVVITPQLVYDFHNPYMVRLFRFMSQQAFQVFEDKQHNEE